MKTKNFLLSLLLGTAGAFALLNYFEMKFDCLSTNTEFLVRFGKPLVHDDFIFRNTPIVVGMIGLSFIILSILNAISSKKNQS